MCPCWPSGWSPSAPDSAPGTRLGAGRAVRGGRSAPWRRSGSRSPCSPSSVGSRLRDSRHTVRQLAANGLAREPGRAAAEGVAVVLATALIAGTWVLLASLHASGSPRLDTLPVPDLTVGAPVGSAPLSDQALDRFRGIKGVAEVVTLPQGVGVTLVGKGERGTSTLSTGVIGQDMSQLLRALPATWDINGLAEDTVYLPTTTSSPSRPARA